MTKIIYQHINRNAGYYELTVKETDKSIIITEKTNHTGGYNKEIRYHKTESIMKSIDYLIKSGDTPWFAYQYTEDYDNTSYWQRWEKVF